MKQWVLLHVFHSEKDVKEQEEKKRGGSERR